jgi:hypothetical protein
MMFGQHDDNQHHQDGGDSPAPDAVLAHDDGTVVAPSDNGGAPVPPPLPNDDDAASDYIMTDAPTGPVPTAPAPHADMPKPAAPATQDASQLLDIKQQALQQLTPMLDHLEQSPEEKFRTTMMMIQAADNDTLIPVAYKAAQDIQDEKARAQALLDIVNEINYFTQNSNEA